MRKYDFVKVANSDKVPNLFIIGTAKAGSTSLFHWLGDHPEIGPSHVHEPRFLMDAEEPLCPELSFVNRGLDGYADLYDDIIGEAGLRYLIDVTPQYYYQKTAQQVISSLRDKKVLFTLRRPSRRIYSLYRYAYHNMSLLPVDMSFKSFVRELERGQDSAEFRGRPMLQGALFHCNYSEHIKHWKSLVGPDNVYVCIFEEVVKKPMEAMISIADFLDIPSDFYRDYEFEQKNKSVAVRFRNVHKTVRRMKHLVPGSIRRSLEPLYFSLNSRKLKNTSSAEDKETLAYLNDLFSEWEGELSSLLERKGPIW